MISLSLQTSLGKIRHRPTFQIIKIQNNSLAIADQTRRVQSAIHGRRTCIFADQTRRADLPQKPPLAPAGLDLVLCLIKVIPQLHRPNLKSFRGVKSLPPFEITQI